VLVVAAVTVVVSNRQSSQSNEHLAVPCVPAMQREVRDLVSEVYGDLYNTQTHLQRIVREVDKTGKGFMTLRTFRNNAL
jgi:hypothetical protein